MLIKTGNDGFIHALSSDITPRSVYHGRRDLMKLMAGGVAGAAMASWASREALAQGAVPRPGKLAELASVKSAVAGAITLEKLTDYKDAAPTTTITNLGPTKPIRREMPAR